MSSSPPAFSSPWRPRPDIVCAMLFVLAHAALQLSWPVILAQDAPMWISEAGLLRAFFDGPLPGGCQLVGALPPNALSQGVIGFLSGIVPVEVAGRIYIVASVGLFAASMVYMCRARAVPGREFVVFSCLPLCAGYPLFHGFLNYMAALPALCLGIGFLLRHPEGRGVRGACILLAMPLFTYLCHGTAVGVWAVLVIVQVWVRRSPGLALRAFPGFVPVLWLIAAYIGQRHAEGASMAWTAGGILATIVYRLRSPLRFFSVFPGFEPMVSDPALGRLAPLLMAVNVAYAVAISVIGVRWAWRARRSADLNDRWLSLSLLAFAALFVLMPHDVAKMLNPAERLLLPAACVGAAGISGAARIGRFSENRGVRLRGAWVALIVAQCTYLAIWGTQAAIITDGFVHTLERYAEVPGVQVVEVDAVPLPAASGAPARFPRVIELMTRHQVLLHQDMLVAWTGGRTIVPPDTGLFRCPTGGTRPTDLAALRSAGQVLLLIGDPDRMAAIALALEPKFNVTRRGPGFWTLVRS